MLFLIRWYKLKVVGYWTTLKTSSLDDYMGLSQTNFDFFLLKDTGYERGLEKRIQLLDLMQEKPDGIIFDMEFKTKHSS